ncbi:trithorax group protein osa-like [Uloborus diversus]|uniref:trithorax group protein osa-like n=1 Tax=Uloborus diversus TaxID=327109 RepID=UPI0024098884|nr:trithorax group protein osa-like [Uloborus diversus]
MFRTRVYVCCNNRRPKAGPPSLSRWRGLQPSSSCCVCVLLRLFKIYASFEFPRNNLSLLHFISLWIMDVIVPCKPNKSIENSNQTVSHPALSTQGYNHQLQPAMWSGSKVCQNNAGQSTNMDPYTQQMNHYYQSPYSSQNANDITRYVSPVSKDQNSNAVAYSPQYPVVRQNNYSCTNTAQNYASVKSNCSNMYYGNVNVTKNYQPSNMVQSPKKYANSSLNVSQAPSSVQHNSQISHSIKSPLPPMPHYREQSNYHLQNAYVNNCNPHSVAENQQTYLVRQTLPSPSLLQSQDNASVQSVSIAQGSQVSQVSSIPTPPETSLPGDVISVLDNASPDGSAESIKMNVSSSSFVLPGSTVSHMSSNMSSPVSSIGNNMTMSNRNTGSSLQPPANLDEGSQASSASASSSIPDDQNSVKANSKPNFSYPPTPNTLSSPGAASMSSFHDDLECISSPGWPKTPASPVATSNYEFANIKRPENLLKLYTLSDEPDRRYFLDKLIVFNEDRGSPITQCPTISKQPLDVYRVYLTVKERGGFVEVTNAKRWKDIAGAIGVGASSSAAYTLRKQYMKLLLPFECKFDRGGIDPQPIINMVEASSRKKGKAPPTSAYGNQNMYGQGYSQVMDRYSGYPGSYPQRYPCNSNVDYQCAPNTMHYPQTVQHTSPHNTVSGQNQYNQYSHTSQANYGYYQGSNASNAPVYNNMQNSINSDICRYGSNATSFSVPQEQTYYPHHYSTQQGQNVPDNIYGSNRSCSVQENHLPPSSSQASADHEQHKSYPKVNALNASSLSSDNVQHQKSAIDAYGTHNSSANSANADPVSDNKMCFSNNFNTVNKMVSSEQSTGVTPSCASTPSQSYQQPAENTISKAPDVEYCSTLVSSHVPSNSYSNQGPGAYASHNSSPYTNQKMHYQSEYQCKDQVQSSQYVQYNEAQNETYRGSEGPPNFQMDRARTTMEGSVSPSKGYQYSCNPPKANAYPYAAQQRNKDMFNNPSFCNQFTSGTPRPWHPEQNQFPHSTGARPQLKSQLNIDPKPNLEGPRMRKSWLNQRDTSQGQNKQPNAQSTSMQQQSFPSKPQVQSNAVTVSQAFQSMVKKPIEFPPNCIESIKPVAVKRRRCPAKRIGAVDPWRVMLALKSGLLVESTWALDALSILLADNSTVVYFGLSHLPGLLNVLVDHYRCFLNNIFDLAPDMEIGNKEQINKKNECEDAQFSTEACNLEEKMRILDTPNFTYKTRCHKKVQIQYDEALFLIDPSRSWEKYEGFDVLQEHWQKGGSDITAHIQTFFDSCSKKVKFFRELDNDKTKQKNGKSPLKAKASVSKENPNVLKSSLLYKGEPVVVLKKFNFLANKISEFSDLESDADMEDDVSVNSLNSNITRKTSENSSVKMEDTDKNSLDFSECINKNDENFKSEFSTSDNSMQDDSCDNDEIKTKSLKTEVFTAKEESMQSDKSCEKEVTGNVPQLRGSLSSRKRFLCEELEDEAYCFDQPALCIMNDSQDMLSRRCVCVSQILRNLSFVPGNDIIISKNAGVLLLMGRLLLLHHEHKPTKNAYRKYEKEADGILSRSDDSCISLKDEQEWWWSTLNVLRENTLVLLSNISGQLDLAPFPEEVSLPILDGLLHWIVCPSSYAQDPLPSRCSPTSVLSPQRLSLEALCKLSVLSSNVDLIIATPPWSRIENLFAFLTKSLSIGQDQLVRELSVVLLSNLSQADCVAARTIAEQNSCISYLIAFIEEAEANAFQIASSQGTKKLRDKPELMGTTPGMVQRAANTLKNLALVPENQVLFMKHQPRLLSLVMSQVMDQELAAIIADVLFYCSEESTGDVSHLFPLS